MEEIDLTDWYRALTLAERTALADIPDLPPVDGDERARRRIAEWRALSALKPGPCRARDLGGLGLTEQSLERLLTLPPVRLRAPASAWLAELSDRRTPE